MTSAILIGHNGAPTYETRGDLPDDLPPLDWFKCNAKEFLDDLLRLPLDERGFFASAVMVLYAEMETLPADDRMAAHRLAMDVRSYRAFLRKMLERKSTTSQRPLLYRRPSGRISNHRYDAEITAYVEIVKKRRDAAAEREEKRKAKSAQNAHTSPGDVQGMSEGCPPIPRTSFGHSTSIVGSIVYGSSEKTQQNQGPTHQTTARALPDDCQGSATERDRERELERKKDTPLPPKGGLPDEVDEQFESWWKLFPSSVRKVGKGECAMLFRTVVTGFRHKGRKGSKVVEHGRATAEQLIDAAKRYAATNPDPRYVPAPATWLNQGRWLDEPKAQPQTLPYANGNGSGGYANGHANGTVQPRKAEPWWWRGKEDKVRKLPKEVWAKAIESYGQAHWAEEYLGPPPGADGCLVASEIVDALKLREKYSDGGGLLL